MYKLHSPSAMVNPKLKTNLNQAEIFSVLPNRQVEISRFEGSKLHASFQNWSFLILEESKWSRKPGLGVVSLNHRDTKNCLRDAYNKNDLS